MQRIEKSAANPQIASKTTDGFIFIDYSRNAPR
jgi:hypothetical protein